MERKLIAFDLDGTLLDNQKQPLNSTIAALKQLKEAGHVVTIATGRNRALAREVIETLAFDYAVMCNGAVAVANGELIYEEPLDSLALAKLSKKLAAKKIDLAVVGLDATYRLSTFNEERMAVAMQSFGSVVPPVTNEPSMPVYQALAYYDEKMSINFEESDQFDFVRWHPLCVDVVPKGGSKATTLLKLADKLGITKENIVAFGDGLNDREMLRTVGLGIAMGNASAEVKVCADMVTATNQADGIWQALEKLNLVK